MSREKDKSISYFERAKVHGLHTGSKGRENQETYFRGDFVEPKSFLFKTEDGDANVLVNPQKGELTSNILLSGSEAFCEGQGFELQPIKGNERFVHKLIGRGSRVEFRSHGISDIYDTAHAGIAENGRPYMHSVPDPRHHEYLFFERTVERYIKLGGKEMKIPTADEVYHTTTKGVANVVGFALFVSLKIISRGKYSGSV